jgi:hypothetical protein
MTATTSPQLGQIHALLAERGYDVSDTGADTLTIRDTASGVSLQAVLQGEILFLSLVCIVVPESAVTPEIMGRMLAGNNGISTAAFKLYEAGAGKIAIALNNFCKLQDMGVDDEDDILSCVHFLLVDVMAARHLLGDLKA